MGHINLIAITVTTILDSWYPFPAPTTILQSHHSHPSGDLIKFINPDIVCSDWWVSTKPLALAITAWQAVVWDSLGFSKL